MVAVGIDPVLPEYKTGVVVDSSSSHKKRGIIYFVGIASVIICNVGIYFLGRWNEKYLDVVGENDSEKDFVLGSKKNLMLG